MNIARIAPLSGLVLVLASGCGHEAASSLVERSVVELVVAQTLANATPVLVESPVTVPEPTAQPDAVPVNLPESPATTAAPADDGLNPFGGNAPEDSLMPSVVCMNLQEAQDEIQDHGVFFSHSEDATGDDRWQINDSNWLVVAQDPEAGAPIGEGDATLFVVKYDDDYPNPC